MWEHRNGVLMDKEKGLIVLQLNEDIHHEYALGFHGFPPNMRHQVRHPIDEVLEMEMKDKHTWLGRVRDARDYADTRTQDDTDQQALRQQQRRFARWIGRQQAQDRTNS